LRHPNTDTEHTDQKNHQRNQNRPVDGPPEGDHLMRIVFGVLGEAVEHISLLDFSTSILTLVIYVSDLNIGIEAEQLAAALLDTACGREQHGMRGIHPKSLKCRRPGWSKARAIISTVIGWTTPVTSTARTCRGTYVPAFKLLPRARMKNRRNTLGVALPFAVIVLMLTTLVLRARRSRVVTGSEGMVGEIGVAVGPLSPSGKVFVHSEYWDAVCVSAVPDGVPVRVTAVERLTLHVQPLSQQPGG
jgi:hypothetical protein